jgi:hypothetical protein
MSPSISAGSTADLISRENEHPLLLPSISPSGEEDTRISPSKPSEVPSTAPSLGGSVDVSLGTLVPTAKAITQKSQRRRRRKSRRRRRRKRMPRNEILRALLEKEVTNDPVEDDMRSAVVGLLPQNHNNENDPNERYTPVRIFERIMTSCLKMHIPGAPHQNVRYIKNLRGHWQQQWFFYTYT